MTEQDGARWDRRYTDRGPLTPGDVAPPGLFRPFTAHFPTAGGAVELACGSGAATVWLARRGLQTVGYDVSPVAINQAKELAERCGQAERCRFEAVDLDEGLPAGDPVDMLLCNKFRDPSLDRPIMARLRAGGVLAISVLSEVGAPPGAFRAKPGELLRAFGALDHIASGEADGEAWLVARRRPGPL